jgi:hypothetical protein
MLACSLKVCFHSRTHFLLKRSDLNLDTESHIDTTIEHKTTRQVKISQSVSWLVYDLYLSRSIRAERKKNAGIATQARAFPPWLQIRTRAYHAVQ